MVSGQKDRDEAAEIRDQRRNRGYCPEPGCSRDCGPRTAGAGLPDLPRRREHDRRGGTQHRGRRHEIQREHSRQPAVHATATPTSRDIRIRTRLRRWNARPATPTRRTQLKRQRARRQQGASVHELPRQRARNFSQDRRALGGVSAERAQDLRPVPQQQRHGGQARIGERLSELHRLDSWVRAEQGRTAGGGQLPKLPRLAQHPEPHQSAEPDLQGEHSANLRQLPRQDQCRLPGRACTARRSPRAT